MGNKSKIGRVVVITNQKGGVGKTTVTRNLGSCLYARGYSVMMIDFDTQGTLSFSCGVRNFKQLSYEETIAYPFVCAAQHKEGSFPIKDLSVEKDCRLSLIPANKTLYRVGDILKQVKSEIKYSALRKVVNYLKPHYDYILIDTPPTISEMLQNAIAAADECLIISTPESFSLDGIIESYNTICDMTLKTASNIGIVGVLINDYTGNRAHQEHVLEQTKKVCEERGFGLFETIIPRATCIEESAAFGQSVIEYKYSSDKARDAFVKATNEFLKIDKRLNS